MFVRHAHSGPNNDFYKTNMSSFLFIQNWGQDILNCLIELKLSVVILKAPRDMSLIWHKLTFSVKKSAEIMTGAQAPGIFISHGCWLLTQKNLMRACLAVINRYYINNNVWGKNEIIGARAPIILWTSCFKRFDALRRLRHAVTYG